MFEWVRRYLSNFFSTLRSFFINLFSSISAFFARTPDSDETSNLEAQQDNDVSIQDEIGDLQELEDLIEQAETDKNAAIVLLSRTPYELNQIEPVRLFTIIFNHREDTQFLNLVKQKVFLIRLALNDVNTARTLLQSSYYRDEFTTLELVEIYYHYHNDNDFLLYLEYSSQPQHKLTKRIFTISEILKKAHAEITGIYQQVYRLFSQAGLLRFVPENERAFVNAEEKAQLPRNNIHQNFNIRDLQNKALTDINAARELLENINTYPPENINDNKLFAIIMKHRHSGDFSTIVPQTILVRLAKDVKYAIPLISSSKYGQRFSAIELASIYYEHRHNLSFLETLKRGRIYKLSEIINKSKLENTYNEVFTIISKSATLTSFLIEEILENHTNSTNNFKKQQQHFNFNCNFFANEKNDKDDKKEYYQEPNFKQPNQQQRHHEEPRREARQKDSSKFNPYVILGVPRDATENNIKKIFRKLALQYHPDKNRDKDPVACGDVMRKIQEAYEILTDSSKRRQWDESYPEGREPFTTPLPTPSELPIFNEDTFFNNHDPYKILEANREDDNLKLGILRGQSRNCYAEHAYRFLIQPEKRRQWDEQHPIDGAQDNTHSPPEFK